MHDVPPMPELTPEQERILGQATSLWEQEHLLSVWRTRGDCMRGSGAEGRALTERDHGIANTGALVPPVDV